MFLFRVTHLPAGTLSDFVNCMYGINSKARLTCDV